MHTAEAETAEKWMRVDNGGRRLGGERRMFVYNGYLPERRSGKERRSGEERRKIPRLE